MRHAWICAAALLVAGCGASSGVKINEQQTSELRPGLTTIAEVTSRYGPPTARIQSSDGTQLLSYSHFAWQVNAATYVPIVGLFAGGGTTKGRTVTMRFDAQGRLIEVLSTDMDSKTGPLIQ